MKIKLMIIPLTVLIASVAVSFWPRHQEKPVHLKTSSFKELPGWETADVSNSLIVFQKSCKTFLKQNPDNKAGSQEIPLQVKDWQPACREAMQIEHVTDDKARVFFQKWFTPVEFYTHQSVKGLFTGYYLPLLHGSYTKTKEFNVPIYGMPSNMVTINPNDFGYGTLTRRIVGRVENGKVVPFYNRAAINNGAIHDKAPVLVWVNSHVDRLFMEIQGSGVVKLPNGEKLYLGYEAENGAAYTPIGKVLVNRGVMTKENASMQRIRAWLESHPEEIHNIMNQNESFVFFRVLKHSAAMGAQGIELTAGYSLAVDRKWIPLGTPLWLTTTHPDAQSQEQHQLQRLMIAQDTGGAIRGQVRGDVFWGYGKKATNIAGLMKNEGHYWLLLPRQVVASQHG